MKHMLAIITVELADESIGEKAAAIKLELLRWFKEDCFFMPWVKQVKSVTVTEEC